jgi:hypothetical protein
VLGKSPTLGQVGVAPEVDLKVRVEVFPLLDGLERGFGLVAHPDEVQDLGDHKKIPLQ